MGFRWQGVVFDSDPLARIGFEVKPAKRKDWHGFNPFFSVQDRNILITQKWAPVPPNPPTANPAYLRVYFSPTLDDVQEDGGWIFVKDGGAFAAVKVVAGGYQWTPAWKHAETITEETKAFITLDTENAPVILIANQAADYGGDFAAFKAAVKAQPVQHADGVAVRDDHLLRTGQEWRSMGSRSTSPHHAATTHRSSAPIGAAGSSTSAKATTP